MGCILSAKGNGLTLCIHFNLQRSSFNSFNISTRYFGHVPLRTHASKALLFRENKLVPVTSSVTKRQLLKISLCLKLELSEYFNDGFHQKYLLGYNIYNQSPIPAWYFNSTHKFTSKGRNFKCHTRQTRVSFFNFGFLVRERVKESFSRV